MAVMSLSELNRRPADGGARDFRTTHWSVVLCAGRNSSAQSAAALETLCRAYWYPLHAFVRRKGYDTEVACDLTQAFFQNLISRQQFALPNPARGKFRSFLLHALQNFLANEWKFEKRLKRGGGAEIFSLDALEPEERYRCEPTAEPDGEKIYERRWAYTLVERALEQLRSEYVRANKAALFEALAGFLPGGEPAGTQAEVAQRAGMSEGALKVAVHRVRHRFREVFREEISDTVERPEEVEEELRHVIAALAQ